MDVAKRKVAPRINRKFGKMIIFAISDRSQENHHAITH